MKELLSTGYKKYATKYATEEDSFGITERWQRKIVDSFYPVCNLNESIFINADYHKFYVNGQHHDGWTIYISQENKEGDWCSLKIYNLTSNQISHNLSKYENKLLEMWKVFYGETK